MSNSLRTTKDKQLAVNNVRQLFNGLFENSEEVDSLIRRNEVQADDLLYIANSFSRQREFLSWYSTKREEEREIVVEVYHVLLESLKRTISKDENYIQTIDGYGQKIGAGAALGGLGALFFGSFAAGTVPMSGPLIFTALGLIGLIGCVWGRLYISSRTQKYKRNYLI